MTVAGVLAWQSRGQASNRVLVIGIDGAGGQYVTQASTPTLDALAAAGVARYDFLNEGALVESPPDGYGASGVNWSTILTGASAAHHGVSDNSFAGQNFDQFPHFFQHAKQHDSSLTTVSLANWTPINTHIAPDQYTDIEVGYDLGTVEQQDQAVADDAADLLGFTDPDALFLHFDQVDHAGHAYSWGSPQHLLAIESVDSLVGAVVDAVNARPGVLSGAEDWLILVTADHGAAPGAFGHYASQGEPNWEVPFFASGPSVAPGTSLQQGTLRDVAATALWHLGVDPFAAGLDGAVRGLEVPAPNGVAGDVNQDGLLSGDGSGLAAEDDVTAFLDNWLVRGVGGVESRYRRGDLNFDGVTDLSDWALLNKLNPAIGQATLRGLSGMAPEPSAAVLSLAVSSLLASQRPPHN
ncbi:alkaline phosphatase family protein [Posidoniimonas polymericola]|nr:alkaline phosphatase family protein [Posidoniimonas polymericola]